MLVGAAQGPARHEEKQLFLHVGCESRQGWAGAGTSSVPPITSPAQAVSGRVDLQPSLGTGQPCSGLGWYLFPVGAVHRGTGSSIGWISAGGDMVVQLPHPIGPPGRWHCVLVLTATTWHFPCLGMRAASWADGAFPDHTGSSCCLGGGRAVRSGERWDCMGAVKIPELPHMDCGQDGNLLIPEVNHLVTLRTAAPSEAL